MKNIVDYFSELKTIDLVLKLNESKKNPFWSLEKYSQLNSNYHVYCENLKTLSNNAISEIMLLNPEQIKNITIRIDAIDNDFSKIANNYSKIFESGKCYTHYKRNILEYFILNYINNTDFGNDWFKQNSIHISNIESNFDTDFVSCFTAKESSFYEFRDKLNPFLNRSSINQLTGFQTNLTDGQIKNLYEQMQNYFKGKYDCFEAIFKPLTVIENFEKIVWLKKKTHLREFFTLINIVPTQKIIKELICDEKGNEIVLPKPKKNEYSKFYGEMEKIINQIIEKPTR